MKAGTRLTDHSSEEYQAGLRDGRLKSLELAVVELTGDMKRMKQLVFALYGAIGLLSFLPEAIEFMGR